MGGTGTTPNVSGTVPIFAPDAQPGDNPRAIPNEMASDAIKAGGMPAVRFKTPEKNPDGTNKIRWVRADLTSDAIKAGGELVPFEQQDVKHPGFWSTLSDYVPLYAKSVLTAGPTSSSGPTDADVAYDEKLQREGHGVLYRRLMSLTPEAERESAESGDVKGVWAHAAGQAAPVLAGAKTPDITPQVTEFGSKLGDAMSAATPKQAAQVVGGVTGAGLGHGTLSVPGAYYGAKGAGSMVESVLGKERANAPIVTPKAQPAPFPEAPPREVLQASPLATVGQKIAPEPASALGTLKPSAAPAGVPTSTAQIGPFKTLAEAPPKLVVQAVDEVGPGASQEQLLQKVNQAAAAPNKITDLNERIKAQEAQKAAARGASPASTPNAITKDWGLDLNEPPEKPVDTDAFAKATQQARTELGPDADFKEDVAPRRDQILKEQGVEAPKGDIGEQNRQKNPEPTSEETGRYGGVSKKVMITKADEAALRAKGYSQEQIDKMRPDDAEEALSAKTPAEVSQMKPQDVAGTPTSKYPPEPPNIKSQSQVNPPSPEDVAETEDIRDKVRRAAEAEDAARLREVKGERKMRNDPNSLKGNLTGQDQFLREFGSEGRNDVSINRPTGSEVKAPDFTKLTSAIENPQQAARQLENLKAAGASDRAINDFEMRASRKFGENWKHLAAQHDNLEGIVRESLKPENIAKFRAKAPKKPPQP